jgi:hypothetical protein
MPLLFVFCISQFVFFNFAYAGKIEDVQSQIKADCQKDLSAKEALPLVKILFLSCKAGTRTTIDGCAVNCLKENMGTVVGK